MRAIPLLVVVVVLLAPGSALAHGGGAVDYRWAGGVPADAELGRTGVVPAGGPAEVWTPDGQAVLSLASAPSTPEVVVELSAVPPWTLGVLPGDAVAGSNAYRIELPDGQPATVSLATPHPASALLHSVDGRDWAPLRHDATVPGRVSAELPAPGFVLVATDAGHGTWPWVPAVAALALVAAGLSLLASQRRRGLTAQSAVIR